MNTKELIARAGGGQNYVSSDSSSSSSSGSSYSSSGSVGGIGGLIVLIIVFVVIFSVMKKKGKGGSFLKNLDLKKLANNPFGELIDATVETATGAGGGAMSVDAVQAAIAQIKVTDPGFNEQIFKDKAQNAFFKIQEAWEKQDINIARPFASDSIIQRYTTQISDLKSRGEKNILENIVIGNMNIVEVRNDNAFNYIVTQIDASCADYTVNAQGKMISGSKSINGFTEYWTFIRTVNVVTDNNKQLKDNKCPNCGAALEVSATGKCNYCGAVVSSGQYDWVLSQIDQNFTPQAPQVTIPPVAPPPVAPTPPVQPPATPTPPAQPPVAPTV